MGRMPTDLERKIAEMLCPSGLPFWGNYVKQAKQLIETVRASA